MSDNPKYKHSASLQKEESDPLNQDHSLQEEYPQETGHVSGKWSDEENIKFVTYLTIKSQAMKSKEKRKSLKIFKQLSEYIVPRTPQQCRSHFQKMMKNYKTLPKLRRYLKQSIGEEVYKERAREIEEELSERFKEEERGRVEVSTQTESQYLVIPVNFVINGIEMKEFWQSLGFLPF